MNERASFVVGLLKFAARSQATDEEKVDDKDHGVDDADGTGGADEIHAGGVRWPVVALLRVAPIFEDGHGAGDEENSADEVENGGHSPWNARRTFVKAFLFVN